MGCHAPTHSCGTPDQTYTGKRQIPKVLTVRAPEGNYAINLEVHTAQSLSDAKMRAETLASHHDP